MNEHERTTNPSKTVVTARTNGPSKSDEGSKDGCLIVIYGNDLGRRIALGSGRSSIGRSSKSDVQIDQESVSRNHAQVSFNGRFFSVKDLGSTNGTYINDVPIESSQLRDGDQIKIGRTIFKFITGNNIETQYHEEIYRLMTIDGLTGVYNKRYFREVLEKEMSRSIRYDRSFAVVLFDIDHFKQINDSHGHLAGDAILRQLGSLVQGRARRDDIIARVGGEEFAALLPEVQEEGASEFARTLRELIEATPFYFEGTRIPVTISLGVAFWNPSLRTAEDILKVADENLYRAKRAGRNRVCG